MRHLRSFALCLVIAVPACKKKDPDAVPLGTSGLSIDVSGRGIKTLLVEEKRPGYWIVNADGQGLTEVTVKNERGMPTRDYLERSAREDELIGEKGSVAEGPNGMLMYHVVRTHCSTCKNGTPQYFVDTYVPTADGAAHCAGWSEEAMTNEHLTICQRLVSSTKPSAAAAAPSDKPAAPPPGAAPPAAPPAPPKP